MPGTDEKHILLVDDNDQILQVLSTLLSGIGYRISMAENAVQAQGILEHGGIDLVISDLHMPGMSGIRLLEAIREQHPGLPVIIVTGDQSSKAAVQCLSLGANDFLTKPFDTDTISRRVASVFLNGAVAAADKADDDGSRIIGGYSILRKIGEGAMGTVLLAEKCDGSAGQPRAIKILKSQDIPAASNNVLIERFIREAETAATVRHPNVVRVLEYGFAREEQIPYIVMEYIEGESLDRHMRSVSMSDFKFKADILRQVAGALAAIHEHGITHRDIKPENIIVDTAGNAKVTDFGIVRVPDSDLTFASARLGTPDYLSPEGFMTPKVDHRSDIFSFGIVAYEYLLKFKPFYGATINDVLEEIRHSAPEAPRKVMLDFPVELEVILAKMLKKSPEDRYQCATDIVRDLDAFLSDRRGLFHRLRFRSGKDDWHS